MFFIRTLRECSTNDVLFCIFCRKGAKIYYIFKICAMKSCADRLLHSRAHSRRAPSFIPCNAPPKATLKQVEEPVTIIASALS